ncbi:hypothetical protein GYMLUDRAFT_165643 [Collybiopsis luxurians FD-317 M1]|uniref:3-phytase n=1 Tax=Collybiopsis luxurians FD-317 M1 TaxID=944289 RepID=A0A0D0CRM3_9AGAR|nr:hypothetical protein GYMLUDRAFT_165643 [Collybiopsis luxurians FD-317 M1]
MSSSGTINAEYPAYNEQIDPGAAEREALLPTSNQPGLIHRRSKRLTKKSFCTQPKFSFLHLLSAFAAGILGCLFVQYAFRDPTGSISVCQTDVKAAARPPHAADSGTWSTTVQPFPPSSPINAVPSLFPTDIGYAGGTPTGAEPALIATAPEYPVHTDAAQLIGPSSLDGGRKGKGKKEDWDFFKHLGNISPWYSNERGTFGLDSDPETPKTCRVTGLHLLHRHGARYPKENHSYGNPAKFARRLHEAAKKWTAKGDLEFMNDWTYKLGENTLTTFGRQQLYDLGISMRLKYGFLLNNFTEANMIPVFRTESQHRMLHSALNFAIGFFGYPLEGQYQQSTIIQEDGFNNTLAPDSTCKNANKDSLGSRGDWYVKRWAAIYLKQALKRLQSQLDGYKLSFNDVHAMQQMCGYETVAIGYSKFCELFTQEEWEGFDYSVDLSYWYDDAFGSPVARVQGAGWVQELLARLEHRRMEPHEHRFSTNSTLNDNPITFPLNQSLYVDATHEGVLLNILTALNISTLATNGPLPYDHMPKKQSFKVSQLAPFASNIQLQLLECSSPSIFPGQQIRIIVNDAPVPLTGIRGCPEQKDGMCPVDTFVKAQREILDQTSWEWGCLGDYKDLLGEGPEWETATGDPPKPRK